MPPIWRAVYGDGGGAPPASGGAQPGGAGAQPDGAGAQPDGAGAQPDGAGAQPDDAGAQPDGSGAHPNGAGGVPMLLKRLKGAFLALFRGFFNASHGRHGANLRFACTEDTEEYKGYID
jgi:hypothetical protein